MNHFATPLRSILFPKSTLSPLHRSISRYTTNIKSINPTTTTSYVSKLINNDKRIIFRPSVSKKRSSSSSSPLHIPNRSINWSHFSPRTKAQKMKFKMERLTRPQHHTNVEQRMEGTKYFVLDEEKELIYANTWLDGQYGVNVLSLDRKSRLPTNYLNDFPDC